MKKEKQFNYFYKITNLLNLSFYYGIHATNKLDDNYMGSGRALRLAIKKYGIENFSKEILLYFPTKLEALDYESIIVNEEMIIDPSCYNIVCGGQTFKKGKVCLLDENGNTILTTIDNKDTLVSHSKGTTIVTDKDGHHFRVSTSDPRYLSGELVSIYKGIPQSDIAKKHLSEAQINSTTNWLKTTCNVYMFDASGKRINKRIKKTDVDEYLKNGWLRPDNIERNCKKWVNNGVDELFAL